MSTRTDRALTAGVVVGGLLLLAILAMTTAVAGTRLYREFHPRETPIHVYYCDDSGCSDGGWKREAGG